MTLEAQSYAEWEHQQNQNRADEQVYLEAAGEEAQASAKAKDEVAWDRETTEMDGVRAQMVDETRAERELTEEEIHIAADDNWYDERAPRRVLRERKGVARAAQAKLVRWLSGGEIRKTSAGYWFDLARWHELCRDLGVDA